VVLMWLDMAKICVGMPEKSDRIGDGINFVVG
jgi:hypothetical protein